MTDFSFSSRDYGDSSSSDPVDYSPTVITTSSTKRLAKTIVNTPPRSMPVPDVIVDDSRDALLTPFSKATLKDRYLTENESYQDRFANCVRYYANDAEHAQRMYDYISKTWCMPATPILGNGGTKKGNLISCFLNEASDSLEGIIGTWIENSWMGAKGGGCGSYFGNVRSIGEDVGRVGKTSGTISFIKVMDSITACISQGSVRRGAAAVYIDMDHPEIEDFIDMRQQSGGDPDRKALNLHHGVGVSDAFMEAVLNDDMWILRSPHTREPVGNPIKARDLAAKLVTTRLETGEPYILFTDAIKRATPEHHAKSGLYPKTSNLCCEITLPTGTDHHGIERTAVCCLFQLNAEKFLEWKDDPIFIEDCAYFLDNVLQDFIDNAGGDFIKSRYSASRERSIGMGVMGFHSFLQSKMLPFEGAMAKSWNMKIFKHVRAEMDKASIKLAEERGACPDAAEHGVMERFSYKLAEAPTASVSIICAGTSAGIDPIAANIYTHKTLDGSFEVKNKKLENILIDRGQNTHAVWNSILKNDGSVAHLDFLDDHEKDVFKTAFEIDPRWIIEHAADRAPSICQSQSLNLWMRPDCEKRDLWKIHELAWKKGIKSLYYLRSISILRTENSDGSTQTERSYTNKKIDYSECLACQ